MPRPVPTSPLVVHFQAEHSFLHSNENSLAINNEYYTGAGGVAGQDTPASLIALCVIKGGCQFFTNLLGYIKAHVHIIPTHRYQIQGGLHQTQKLSCESVPNGGNR